MTTLRKPVVGKVVGYLFAIVFVLVGWWVTAALVDSPVLPSPADTFPVMVKYASDLLPHLAISTVRVVVSLFIGTALAVPIALVCAHSRVLDPLFAPVLYILYPIPKVVLLPILLVLLGLADAPKIVLISLTIFFQVLVSVRDAARAIPESLVLAARSLGANSWQQFVHVVVPATLPAVFTSLRIGVGTAIAVLFIAESFAGQTGLGYFIMQQSWSMMNYPRMFAGIVALSLLGVLLYIVFDILERAIARWQ